MKSREEKNLKRKENTRRTLLSAAVVVFSRQGYHKTLISDIVAEAGVGQGTFYRHFTDKREIFEILTQEFLSSLLNEFQDMSHHLPEDFSAYRTASVQAVMRLSSRLAENKELVLCLFKEAPSIDKDFATAVSQMKSQFAALAQYYLDHAIKQGFARNCNSQMVSQAVVGMGLHIISQWLEGHVEMAVKDLVEEIVDFGFLGLAR